jgi:maltodextrin utilization protein YvdJ
MKNQLSIVQVDNEQMTIHSPQQTQLETPFHPPTRKKRKPLSLDDAFESHWLHGNSILKIGCHYLWLGLIALLKNTLLIEAKSNFLDHQF